MFPKLLCSLRCDKIRKNISFHDSFDRSEATFPLLWQRHLNRAAYSLHCHFGPTKSIKLFCVDMCFADTQTGMLIGKPTSAMCVQMIDDSLSFAIRLSYRISLRSSSLWEPRHPLLKGVLIYRGSTRDRSRITHLLCLHKISYQYSVGGRRTLFHTQLNVDISERLDPFTPVIRSVWSPTEWVVLQESTLHVQLSSRTVFTIFQISDRCGNDPSAGSPTETLLRLHLPLNDKV